MNNKFLLFSSCILVKGSTRSVICDLQRNFIYPIPDALVNIVENYRGHTLNEIKSKFDNKHDEAIDEYFDFLINEDLIFFSDSLDVFPPLPMEWDEPFQVTNAIIDVKDKIDFALKFMSEIKDFGCHTVQIRCFGDLPFFAIEKLLSTIGYGRVSSVEIIIKHCNSFTLDKLTELCEKFHRLSVITVYSSPIQNSYHVRPDRFGYVFFIASNITSEKCCGIVAKSNFTINIKTFTEAQHHNTCLNRKISIDTEGNIKNCPSMKESYGNIRDTTLMEALEKPGFKKYWNISKDQIEVCKDCEFRYICTDCRAYLEDPENILSKPLKCGYSPYTCEWEEWSTNPLKQKAIEYYGIHPDSYREVKKEPAQATAKPE